MIYIGEYIGYQVWQNDDGNMEAFKSTGVTLHAKNIKIANSSNRIVSNTSDLLFFIDNYLKKKPAKKTNERNPKQLDLFQ